ncbi:uncharacterized protein L201_005305 [Kwoniella dendrophila CBS 6074]|uniref:Alpha/beta hydrolase fold-3 domain-containing protein n=1 Tax=Kwoniella dendrophila CBS 6074 TaxID=1295534 RepID=A0AAX4K0B4_9TREE
MSASLLTQAKALRDTISVIREEQLRAIPWTPIPTTTEYIDSRFGACPAQGCIRLDIYQPISSVNNANCQQDDGPRLAMITFHGGGFVIGEGTDDAIFAKSSMDKLGSTVIAVSYRLSPEYPFPIPVEDAVSAILHISNNSERYGLDQDKIVLAGFSAGASLALTSSYILNTLKSNPWGYTVPENLVMPKIKIKGLILIYPLLDYTTTREEKMKTSLKPEEALSIEESNLFENSYLPKTIKHLDKRDARISPSLASDELVKGLPPIFVTICEYDILRDEALVFIDRLKSLGKKVDWSEVKGENHCWDRPPPIELKNSVLVEYGKALDVAGTWLEQ